MLTRTVLGIAFALAAFGGTAYWFWEEPITAPVENAHYSKHTAESDVKKNALETQPIPVKTSVKAPAASPVAETLLDDLATSANYRIVLEEAKRSPRKGGFYVAHLINERCSQVRHQIVEEPIAQAASNHATAQLVQQSAERLRLLCSGLIDDDIDFQKGILAILQHPDRKIDPLLTAQDRYTRAIASGNKSDIREALLAVVSQQAPTLFINTSLPMQNGSVYFDGQLYPLGENGTAKLLSAAKMLAACSVWNQCGDRTDFYMLIGCSTQGVCEDSYEKFVGRMIAKDGTQEDVERVREIASVMAKAIRQGNLNPFLPPS